MANIFACLPAPVTPCVQSPTRASDYEHSDAWEVFGQVLHAPCPTAKEGGGRKRSTRLERPVRPTAVRVAMSLGPSAVLVPTPLPARSLAKDPTLAISLPYHYDSGREPATSGIARGQHFRPCAGHTVTRASRSVGGKHLSLKCPDDPALPQTSHRGPHGKSSARGSRLVSKEMLCANTHGSKRSTAPPPALALLEGKA